MKSPQEIISELRQSYQSDGYHVIGFTSVEHDLIVDAMTLYATELAKKAYYQGFGEGLNDNWDCSFEDFINNQK